jgi:hypothetical protein
MSVELIELKALEVEEEKIQSLPSIKHHISQVSRNAKAIEVANADYALALSAGSLSPTSFRSLQLYLILLIPFMSSLSYGFDGSGEYSSIRKPTVSYILFGRSYECGQWDEVCE